MAPQKLGRFLKQPHYSTSIPVAGFSLIELLSVVAVLGVLIALVSPGILAAKRRANVVQCRGNLRQLGLAVRLYADDNDGLMPALQQVAPVATGPSRLSNLLRQYVGTDVAVFHCREDKRSSSRLGDSYEWNPALHGRLSDPRSGATATRQVLDKAMIYDREAWHGFRNAVFTDGHVDKLD